MPEPPPAPDQPHHVNRLLAEQVNYDQGALRASVQRKLPTLNADQRALFDVVVDALEGGPGSWVSRNRQSNTFFVDSPGGCGKTYIFNLLLEVARRDGRVALAVASSGIAALLLDGGKTAHSQLKIPVNIHADSLCNVSASSELAELLRATELIVWDEAPMMHKHCFEAVDRTLRDLTCRDWGEDSCARW